MILLILNFLINRGYPVLLTGKMDDSLSLFLYGAEQIPGRVIEIVSEDIEVLSPVCLNNQIRISLKECAGKSGKERMDIESCLPFDNREREGSSKRTCFYRCAHAH